MFKTLKGTYYTCDDVADMVGLTSQTVRDAFYRGDLRGSCPRGRALRGRVD